MAKLIYSMTVSLDGFIADPAGEIDWGAPDAELHRFHNDQARELGATFLGKRLYQEMLGWETIERDPSAGEIQLEFARIWNALPKVVFSTTLERVEGNARLASGEPADEVAQFRSAHGPDVSVGGAGLAAGLTRLGLIDEYRMFVSPVVLGGGTPYFPPLERRLELQLLETRTFGSRVVYLRYRRV